MFGFGTRYATSDAVTLKKDTVLKKVDPRFVETEVRVTQVAYDLARTSGLFCVPQVIGYDLRTGLIEFERVNGFITLGEFLAKKPNNTIILRRVGKVLAHIHKHLQVPSDLCLCVASQWLNPNSDVVPLHGDFNTINVGYKKDADVIVVWDWASDPILGARITMGPRYFDLAHFLRSMLVHQPSTFKAIRRFTRRMNLLIDGYHEETGESIDLHTLRGVLLDITTFRMREQFRRKSFFSALSNLMWYLIFRKLTKEW